MADCLIVTSLADEFAVEIARLSAHAIQVRACRTPAEALERYAAENVLFGNPQMIAETLSAMPEVRWVQSSWAGVAPLIEHPRRDYVLTGVKGVFGPQMAEYALGYMLAHELRVFVRRERQLAADWAPMPSGQLSGKQLGILGTGSIGSHVAAVASSLGMRVSGLSRSGKAHSQFDRVFCVHELGDFLSDLDYLVSTLPETAETEQLIDRQALAALRPSAYIINVGRASVIDTDALVTALREHRLAGAVLDVFDEEPLPASSPLWDTTNLLVTPHIAALSHPMLIVPVFVENFRRYQAGKPLQHVVDFSTGY